MRRGTLATLALVGLSALVPSAGAEEEPRAVLARADQTLAAGQFADAERLFREVIETAPNIAEAHFGLARALSAQGRNAEGATVLTRMGGAALGSGQSGIATQALEKAIELNPGSAEAEELLGRALLREDAFQDAAVHLRRAMALGDATLAVRFFLGAALWESGEMEEVERLYQEALEMSRRDWVALRQLGGLYLWQGRYEDAADLLGEAVRKNPTSADLMLDWGRALEGAGQIDAALGAYRGVVLRAPEIAAAHYQLGVLLAKTGQKTEAAQELEVFHRFRKQEEERLRQQKLEQARVDGGWAMLRQGKWEDAARQFRDLPETPDSLEGLAAALAAGGRHREAASVLEKALALAPERRGLSLQLARERELAGQEEKP
jgi:tetratricopeptide (TPR) repeat protein